MTRLRVKRVPRRYQSLLTAVALTVSMSAVVSFFITLRHVGVCGELPGVWLAAWQLSCAIALPARFVVAPLVSRFVGVLVEPAAARRC